MDKATYIAVTCPADPETLPMLIALLSSGGFEGFEEHGEFLTAYIIREEMNPSFVRETLTHLGLPADFQQEEIPPKNWNTWWESNYSEISVDGICRIASPFHLASGGESREDWKYTVVINPQMSFGTGHHATTRLMIRQMDRIDFRDTEVLDMGCGTSVLGILALKMGARSVLGIDIDPWSVENSQENLELNQVGPLEVKWGDASAIPPQTYDRILANINRNVLLNDMAAYCTHLKPSGYLLLSGFYMQDIPALREAAGNVGLSVLSELTEDHWASLAFNYSKN